MVWDKFNILLSKNILKNNSQLITINTIWQNQLQIAQRYVIHAANQRGRFPRRGADSGSIGWPRWATLATSRSRESRETMRGEIGGGGGWKRRGWTRKPQRKLLFWTIELYSLCNFVENYISTNVLAITLFKLLMLHKMCIWYCKRICYNILKLSRKWMFC